MGDDLADPRNREKEVHLGEAKEMIRRRVEEGEGPSGLSGDETYRQVIQHITRKQEEYSPTGEMVKEDWIDEAFTRVQGEDSEGKV